jgi:hypothetical protein
MSEEIFFTTNAYAEVSDSIADLLSGNIDEIIEVAEPSNPGDYYQDAGGQTQITVVLDDETFNDITVSGTTTTGSLSTDEIVNVYDYIIDPSEDDVATVLNNLSDGDSVWLGVGTHGTTGTYSDGAIIDITANDVTVAGASGSRIKHDSSTTDSGEGVRLIEVRGDDVTLRGFTVNGDYQNAGTINDATDGHNIAVYGNDFHMEGVRSYYSTGDGIEPFIGSDNGTIVGCHFKENYEQNIHFNSCSDWVATGNVLEGEINNGMVSTYAGDGYVTKDCVFADNLIKNGSHTGLQLESGDGELDGFTSKGNIYRGMAKSAILVKGNANQDAAPKNIDIDDQILGSQSNGVAVNTGENITIGGKITNVGQRAVSVDAAAVAATDINDVEISATIRNCGTDGSFTPAIEVKHGDNAINDVHISPTRIVNDAGNQNNAVFVNNAGTGSFSDVYIRGGWYDPSHNTVFNIQEPITAVAGTEPRYATDLSQYGNAQPGTEMWSDGTTGTAGPHVFDGSTWNGYAQASGSTVTP